MPVLEVNEDFMLKKLKLKSVKISVQEFLKKISFFV